MTSNYSRKDKDNRNTQQPTKHIKTGLSALQKTLALVGSILSIIVATITITKALHPENSSSQSNDNQKTSSTIVKIIEKDKSSQESSQSMETDTANNTSTSSTEEPLVNQSNITSETSSLESSESQTSTTTSSTTTP